MTQVTWTFPFRANLHNRSLEVDLPGYTPEFRKVHSFVLSEGQRVGVTALIDAGDIDESETGGIPRCEEVVYLSVATNGTFVLSNKMVGKLARAELEALRERHCLRCVSYYPSKEASYDENGMIRLGERREGDPPFGKDDWE